jgi:hypothetical protein
MKVLWPLLALGVLDVLHPVLLVQSGKFPAVDYEQVLRISFFSAFGEVKAASDDPVIVYDYHFVVGDCMA